MRSTVMVSLSLVVHLSGCRMVGVSLALGRDLPTLRDSKQADSFSETKQIRTKPLKLRP